MRSQLKSLPYPLQISDRMAKVLVVEDSQSVGDLVTSWLTSQNHIADWVKAGDEALLLLKEYPFDLIILDINLPGKDGYEICKEFRDAGGKTPILMLTGKNTIQEKEQGLDLGADDYLTKPFDVRELGARIRALLRRPAIVTTNSIELGNISIDAKERTVSVNKSSVDLAPKEFALLEFFAKHPNQVFSPEAILDRVWNSDSDATADSVRVYINRLRNKLGNHKETPSITNVFGVGYKMNWKAESTQQDGE